jgi:NADH-quinone oxidoreductase subunit L
VAVGCAVTGAAAALGAALWLAALTWSGRPGPRVSLLAPLDLGAVSESLSVRVLPVSALVAVAVTVVSLAVQVYSAGYLVDHSAGPDTAGPGTAPGSVAPGSAAPGSAAPGSAAPGSAEPVAERVPLRYAPYAATISLFTAAMLVVTHADDLLLMLVGWELMGLCSYLLIGHHSERPSAKKAALQAFLVTKVGDVGFMLAVVALYSATQTTSISAIVAGADTIGARQATTIGLGLVLGVIGKSAQFPLHGWLPDAMEGPTPVSALIHAATMVAAGVVVLVRFGPLLQRSPTTLTVLAVVSSVTMVGAALAAFGADDLKRVLAWSTVSQVAVMLSAVSLGSPAGRAGAIAHLLSHAAFKSLLFLVAG